MAAFGARLPVRPARARLTVLSRVSRARARLAAFQRSLDEAAPAGHERTLSDLRAFSRELLERAERDGVFAPLAAPARGAASGAGPPAEVESLFETNFVVGVWRRAEYKLGAFPLALCGSFARQTVALGPYESLGTVWRFVRVGGAGEPPAAARARGAAPTYDAILECHEAGESPLALTADLRLASDPSRAAVWTLEEVAPFRRVSPLDVAVRVSLRGDAGARALCAREADATVALLTAEQSAERDARGGFVWNVAWECTPEMEGADGGGARGADASLAFLDKYLDDDDDAED